MPTAGIDVKWSIALFLTLLGAVALWVQLELADVQQQIQLIRQSQFDAEEFNLAISFRDDRIGELEDTKDRLLERIARLETLNSEYRDWVRMLGPRVNDAVAEMSKLDGAFATIGHQVSAILLEMQEVKEKQDEVREQLIPGVERKVDAHTNQPHNGMIRMTPNAR